MSLKQMSTQDRKEEVSLFLKASSSLLQSCTEREKQQERAGDVNFKGIESRCNSQRTYLSGWSVLPLEEFARDGHIFASLIIIKLQ